MAGLGSAETDLSGRRALVTGAASGIGLAIARHLGDLRAAVVLSDLAGERLDSAVAGIPGAEGLAGDLSRRSDVHDPVAGSGGGGILAHNAGPPHVRPVRGFDEAP